MQCCVHWQGLVRVFLFGCLIWRLREKVSQRKLAFGISEEKKKLLQKLVYGLANGILAAIVVYTNFGRRSAGDFVVIALFALCLFGLLLVKKKKYHRSCPWYFKNSGAVTYPIYLFQMPVIEWLVIIGILHA